MSPVRNAIAVFAAGMLAGAALLLAACGEGPQPPGSAAEEESAGGEDPADEESPSSAEDEELDDGENSVSRGRRISPALVIVLIVVASVKFIHGAWVVILVVPILIAIFLKVHQHYRNLAASLTLLAVELFEATDGFGVMANTDDPIDLVANAAGVGLAVIVDIATTGVLRRCRDRRPDGRGQAST